MTINPAGHTIPVRDDGTGGYESDYTLPIPGTPTFTTSKTSSSITATITNSNGATSYEVRVDSGTPVAGLTVSGLSSSTQYAFQVRGVNSSGNGPWSAVDNVTTNASGGSSPAYTPMVALDFAGKPTGQATAIPDGWYKGDYVSSPTKTGNRSLKLRNGASEVGSCPYGTGALFYGGRFDLPDDVPVGYTIWQRWYMYFPSTMSWGYKYPKGDSEFNSCGLSEGDDGTDNRKFLVFAPASGTARSYLFVPMGFRQVGIPNSWIKIDTEADSGDVEFLPYTYEFDKWVSWQQAVKVSSNGTGWIRVWIDDTFIGESTGINTVVGSGNSIREWGLGDYWNGYPYTDGGANRNFFYVDDIIVASDLPGYGAPNGVDSGGRPYIPTNHFVGDFS